jgi:hypothetical protein
VDGRQISGEEGEGNGEGNQGREGVSTRCRLALYGEGKWGRDRGRRRFQWRKKLMEEKMPTGGSRSSEGEREKKCTGSGFSSWAAGLFPFLGRRVSLRPSFIFLFYFLLFFF